MQSNIEVVKNFLDAFQQRNLPLMESFFAEDVTWHMPGHHPLAGVKRGSKEVMAFFELAKKARFTIEVLFVEANDRYVTDVHRGFSNCQEAEIDTLWVMFWEIENGKIKRAQNFPEDQHATDAFFWKLYQLKPLPDRLA